MVDVEYANAFYEVLNILEYVDITDYEKIPSDLIQTFRTYANWNWNFKYDVSKTLDEQNVSMISKAIIANIFKNYWATPYQKERIETKERYDRQKAEEEKRAKYNPDDIFNKRNKVNIEQKMEETTTNLPIEVKKEKFFEKIISFFKKIFHIN